MTATVYTSAELNETSKKKLEHFLHDKHGVKVHDIHYKVESNLGIGIKIVLPEKEYNLNLDHELNYILSHLTQ